jgi:putative ABC transport system permease protein
MFLYCFHESTYDRFHSKVSEIYLLRMDYISNGEVIFGMYPPTPVYEILKTEFSQIKRASRVYVEKEIFVKSEADVFREGNFLKVDPGFFEIFDFNIETGKSNSIFQNPKSIFISKKIAQKYFKGEYPVGKTIELTGKEEYSIAGIIDPPSNSSIQFDFITSTLPADSITWQFGVVSPIYFQSSTLKDAESVSKQLQTAIDEQYGEGSYRLELVPLLDQYFHNNIDYALHGDKRYITVFIGLSLIILLLSIINYINLTTAQSIKRSKEIGVRKVVGGLRYQLVQQHLIESASLVAVSMIISFLLFFLSIDSFKTLVGKDISLMAFNSLSVVGFLILFFIVITILSGLYPALWITKLQPVYAINNQVKTGRFSGSWLRKSIVVFQFTISSLFIIMTLVIQSQMDFVLNQKLGFEKDQILRLKIPRVGGSNNPAIQNYSLIKKELLEIKSVSGVTVSPMPDFDASFEGIYQDNGEEKSTNAFVYKVDEDFIKVIGANLIEGKNLDAANPKEGILINQTAAKLFFEGDPIGMENKMLSKKKVIGIVNDFYFNGMRSNVQPLVLEHFTKSFNSIQIKITTNNVQETIAEVKNVWKKYAPDQVFEFSFLKEDYNRLYINETRIAEIFSILCFASIIIACLGLIGTASYFLKNLMKNLSIRKVFGASVKDILMLVIGIFFKPILLSIVMAVPIALWFSSLYLQEFVYRVNLSTWLFIFGALITIVLVIISIGFQSLKAASSNPLINLKEQ